MAEPMTGPGLNGPVLLLLVKVVLHEMGLLLPSHDIEAEKNPLMLYLPPTFSRIVPSTKP